jgi:hypothetical protein
MNVKLAGAALINGRPMSQWRTPLGFRADGRPIYPIAGGAPDGDDDGDDDDLDLDDDGDDDDGDDDGDLSDAEKKLLGRLDKSLDEKLTKATDRIADRLVNAQRTAERKAARQRDRDGAGTGRTSSSARQAEQREQQVAGDIREARLAFKDAFADHGIRLATPEMREAASAMGRALVESAVRGGADPDDAGIDAAKKVAATIKGVQKSAESSVLRRLEKQGVDLTKIGGSGSQPGKQPGRGPGKPGIAAQVKAGEDRAVALGLARPPATSSN